jgi:uncharacterized protein YkwD
MMIPALLMSLVMLTNAERATPLTVDMDLTYRAQLRAEYLCAQGFSNDGWEEFFTSLTFSYKGENLAKGFADATSTHRALMESAKHKANIVDTKYTHMGVGNACGITVELFGGRNLDAGALGSSGTTP